MTALGYAIFCNIVANVQRTLENRDDRVLVRAVELFDDWYIKPTSVYLKSDLELAAN